MDITSFIVIGALVSVVVQIIKNKFGTNSTGTLASVLIISIVSGAAYFYIVNHTSLLQPIIQILAFAGAVYTFIIKRFQGSEKEYY